mgnify:CR=1 FL=1
MTNDIKFESGNLADSMALSIVPGKADYSRERETAKASERFLHSAALLPEKEVIGLQISADAEGAVKGYAFFSPGIKVTVEDFDWIFKSYGSVDRRRSAKLGNLFEGSRKVYMLRSIQRSPKDSSELWKRESYFNDYDDTTSDSYFSDMFTMLMEEAAVIRIIVGSSDENALGHGMILISLPEEMTLRMRTMISLAFPHTAAEEAEPSFEVKGENKGEKLLPDGVLLDGMARFLFSMICRESGTEYAQQGEADEIAAECEAEKRILDADACDKKPGKENDTAFTAIEELNLSVRSYHCLKRAGVDSVEKLRTMTEEDFMRVRNLSRKSVYEIKRKLAEIDELTINVPLQAANYMDMLNELIGLEDVKEQLRKIVAFARMKKDMADNGNDNLSVSLNMEFVGNPGTAKTTVARIAAGIFHEVGLLPGDGLIEVGRADLVAKYEGQTASKVKEIFQKAKGKVLFLDEAYSLSEDREGEFGDEAINTIVQEMENNREDTIVIFAGYPDKMEGFFARNPGLRSRVPFSITFKDYSLDELLQIVELEAKKRGFSISPLAKDKLLSFCEMAAGEAEYGNGRFCRNLVENAILEYASKRYGSETSEAENDFELTERDFTGACVRKKSTKNTIGFCIR